jgi:hypothetical protein
MVGTTGIETDVPTLTPPNIPTQISFKYAVYPLHTAAYSAIMLNNT